jgi:hypothetical protein
MDKMTNTDIPSPKPRIPLRDPIQNKDTKAINIKAEKKIFGNFSKAKNIPNQTGREAATKRPKELGSLNVELICPKFTKNDVLPKSSEWNLWIKAKRNAKRAPPESANRTFLRNSLDLTVLRTMPKKRKPVT